MLSEETSSPTQTDNYSTAPPPEGTNERRNYERLLDAASEHFTVQGPNAPLGEIARDAGVDNSTLNRWFPSRGHLIVAVSERHIQEIADKCVELGDRFPPDEALVEWIRFLVAQVATRRELVAATFALQAESGAPVDCNLKVAAAASDLLDQAKAAGALRSDVEGRDVASLIAAVAFATETNAEDQVERFLGLVLEGIQLRDW